MEQPLIVRAEYSFVGSNNDELCFKKGEIITVTQREDGGWWEGTLNDKTGWFPSNYVNEYKAQLPLTETIRPPEEIQEYRSVVLKDLLDSERAHVAELQGLLENFLEPMQQTQILSQDEYAQLMCNFVEVVRTHEELLIQIEECNDRVGKLFLSSAPLMKKVHQAYCAAHPKAIVILDKYKDELEKYMERQGAATPGLLVLTTGLSKPFRRLDKYSAMLQELERHMESSHPDRGDTQRSVAVYKDIAATCSATRRQKELELQVLTGPVRNWQGQELSTLGDIIHMGSVAVGADHRDRYFVLFPQTLLILSVSQRMSAFIYEGKLPLTGIVVHRLEDTDQIKNAFEISSPLIERIVAVCQGPNEANKWVELLNANNPSLPMGIKRQLSNLSNSSLGNQLNAAHPATPHYERPLRLTLPPSNYPPTAPYANLSAHFSRLVRHGRLRSAIVKLLLYPQARQSIDLKRIALRKKRCHKAAAKLLKDFNDNVESTQSSLERQDAFELPTDSESYEDDELLHSCSSDPFEYVKFYEQSCNSTGTFVDYGQAKPRLSSSINLIKLDSVEEPQLKKESLVIGSRALRALARKSTERLSSVHTSTATIELGGASITNCIEEEEQLEQQVAPALQQQASDASSLYAARLGGTFNACENLAIIKDETQPAAKPVPSSPTERHSMPSIFVGNRFNSSADTQVYVPSRRERQLQQQQQSLDAEEQVQQEQQQLHASSLDLPAACRSAPDQLQAELLYNYDGNLLAKPPACSSAQEHSTRDSMRRCISYQYLQMNQSQAPSSAPPKGAAHDPCKCRCCESSQCPSPRSSDSGMAGSCTIASPDPPSVDTLDAAHALLEQVQPERRFDVCGMFREQFLEQQQQQQLEQQQPEPAPTSASKPEFQINTKSIFLSASSLDEPGAAAAQSPRQSSSSAEQLEPPVAMFRSGMYAHWWKKERLPPEVLRGIAAAYNKRLDSKDSVDSSVCSSCYCSLGASSFSEGTLYCAICHNCADYAPPAGTSTTNTNTTTTSNGNSNDTRPTSSCSNCPVCSEDAPAQLPAARLSYASLLDCPICAARMSPPSSHSLMLPNSRNQTPPVPPASATSNNGNNQSQHKRSLSFNHHLSYNQYTHTQPLPHHLHPPQPPSLPSHLGASHKSNLVPTPNNKTAAAAAAAAATESQQLALQAAAAAAAAAGAVVAPNARKGSTKANWTISCLRPTPPLRPSLLNASSGSNSTSAGGGSGGGSSSNNALASYCSGRKTQPTFEEDALVLRVFEGYCAAYQNSARNTIHSALNAAQAQRYSLTGGAVKDYQRALSEERATRKSLNRLKSGFGSGYDNVCTSPLLPRKNKPAPKLQPAGGSYQRAPAPANATGKPQVPHPGLYDRRLNRSFETSSSHRYAGYGGGYLMNCGGANLRNSNLQRSTPQLASGERSDDSDAEQMPLRNGAAGAGAAWNMELHPTDAAKRQSGSWCCGLENEDLTPTLRQLWTAIKQMQQDMSQIKLQINEERALRADLQQLLMQHLETSSVSSGANTPKC
ncbi:rtGEF [Drosophila busckii]|uniref:RtGEF n=1 Tax=Drosophila busckii TaxID=30019 RepID=A0A0M5IYM0_DROBS|nr:rtGEF [Drosophila busckii]